MDKSRFFSIEFFSIYRLNIKEYGSTPAFQTGMLPGNSFNSAVLPAAHLSS